MEEEPDSILKCRDFTLPTKVCLFKAMFFPVVMYGCESWTIKKAECWRIDAWTVVLKKTLESHLNFKEIKPVNLRRNHSWIFIGRTDVDADDPVLWPPDAKYCFLRKDPDAGQDWRQEEKGMTEDEIVVWHHRLDGYEFEQASGVGYQQGSLACCRPWGCKESDMTEQLKWTEYPLTSSKHNCFIFLAIIVPANETVEIINMTSFCHKICNSLWWWLWKWKILKYLPLN